MTLTEIELLERLSQAGTLRVDSFGSRFDSAIANLQDHGFIKMHVGSDKFVSPFLYVTTSGFHEFHKYSIDHHTVLG